MKEIFGIEIPKSKTTDIADIEWPEEITNQEKLFVSYYISDAHWDPLKAFLFAGYNPGSSIQSSRVRAHNLLNKDHIQKAIDIYTDTVIRINKNRAKVNIIELQRSRAFYDPAMLINADGSLKYRSLEEVPPEVRAAIDGIETKWYGKNADVQAVSVKLADRDRAMAHLTKLLNLNEEKETDASKDTTPVINISINGTPQISELPEED